MCTQYNVYNKYTYMCKYNINLREICDIDKYCGFIYK